MNGPDRDLFYDHLPVYTGGNVFFNGALPCDREQNFAQETEHPVTLTLEEADGTWKLCTDLYRYLPDVPASVISTKVLERPSSRSSGLRILTGLRLFSRRIITGRSGGSVLFPGLLPQQRTILF